MKKILLSLLLICLCNTVSFGEIVFDYTISDTYEILPVTLNGESLLVTGAGADTIDAFGESYVEVQGTDPLQQHIGGIYILHLTDFSSMDYYNGEMGNFKIYDDATAMFSGGSIDFISSYQASDLTKHITFIVDVDSVGFAGGVLTGNWLDGSGFSVTLLDQSGYDSVYSNINFVPEPATLALFGLGGLLLRRKK